MSSVLDELKTKNQNSFAYRFYLFSLSNPIKRYIAYRQV
jgi:hypothetical protein